MKTFTFIAVALLAITAFGIFSHTNKEESYSARLDRIAREINSQNGTWRAENPGRFLNMKKEQVKALMGTFMEENSRLKDVTEVIELDLNAPDSFNSADQWPKCQSIKEIRDQANCGSCWAFGAVEAMSDRICISSDQTVQTRVSSEDLNTCCRSCGMGCNGGYPSAAWEYFASTGLVTGDLYGNNDWCRPYTLAPCAHHTQSTKYPPCPQVVPTPACTQKCNSQYPGTYNKDKHYGKNAYSVRGETKMKAELSTNGPFEVAFSVYEDFLTYK